MAVTMKQLGIDKLSVEDRLELYYEILESVMPPRIKEENTRQKTDTADAIVLEEKPAS